METGAAGPAESDGRVARQKRIVGGVVLVLLAGVALLLAPGLTGALVKDLPYLAVSLVALFAGGILLGTGAPRRRAR
jgi:hypothetical protein